MKRDYISISENCVTVTGSEVWMTVTEISELFGATAGVVTAGITGVLKIDVLNDYEVCKYITLENGNGADVYNMEVITALAFRLDTRNTSIFRKWLTRKAVAPTRTAAPIIIQYKEGFLN